MAVAVIACGRAAVGPDIDVLAVHAAGEVDRIIAPRIDDGNRTARIEEIVVIPQAADKGQVRLAGLVSERIVKVSADERLDTGGDDTIDFSSGVDGENVDIGTD